MSAEQRSVWSSVVRVAGVPLISDLLRLLCAFITSAFLKLLFAPAQHGTVGLYALSGRACAA